MADSEATQVRPDWICTIDDNFAGEIARAFDRRSCRWPRSRDCDHFTKGSSFGDGAGARIRATLSQQRDDFRLLRVAHAKLDLVSCSGPALTQRAANVSCSDDTNIHNDYFFED